MWWRVDIRGIKDEIIGNCLVSVWIEKSLRFFYGILVMKV